MYKILIYINTYSGDKWFYYQEDGKDYVAETLQEIKDTVLTLIDVYGEDYIKIVKQMNDSAADYLYDGTNDYEELKNHPTINGIEVIGQLTLDELGIQPIGNYASQEALEETKAKVEEIDLTPYATIEYVDAKEIDLTDYATKEYVDNKEVDLTNYYTKAEVDEAISDVVVDEVDPTVPAHVKAITEEQIATWDSLGENGTGEVVAEMSRYSEKERLIGTWIDNKPLYRKVINCGPLPNNGISTVEHGAKDVDKVVRLCGAGIRYDGETLPIPYTVVNADNSGGILVYANTTGITLRTSNDRSNYNAYIIIEYTKTIDEPTLPEEEDLTEELEAYGTKLTEQETKINNIIEELGHKASGSSSSRSLITVGLSSDAESTSYNSSLIPLNMELNKKGSELSLDTANNAVKIGAGVSKILVSGTITQVATTTGLYGGNINKNGITLNTAVNVGFNYIPVINVFFKTTFSPVLVDVVEGDLICLTSYAETNKPLTIKAYEGRSTNLTVEVIE